jgi:hypothetical protein
MAKQIGVKTSDIASEVIPAPETELDQTLATDTPDPSGVLQDSNLVYVALNHPQGILFSLPDKRAVLIEGNATHLRGLEKGVLPVGGYGLTEVAADDWDYIKKTYGQMRIFQTGLIFAQNRRDLAMDQAGEMKAMRHGREPVDPTKTNTTEASVEA